RLPQLTALDSFKSGCALALGALAFEVRSTAWTHRLLLRWLPWSALVNLGAGLLLSLSTDRSFYRIAWGALRLQGAVVPAHLAYLGLAGLLFSLTGSFSHRSRLGLAMLNLAVVTWTGSRAAMLEGVLLVATWLLVDGLRARSGRAVLQRRERALLAAAVPLVLATYWPFMAARLSAFHAHLPGEVVSLPGELEISTTGRLRAWRFFWGVARENPWFGRGLGAGVEASVGHLHSSFRVPHNEYLRLVVDGGFVGLGAMLLGYGLVGRQVVRSLVGAPERLFVLAALAALAFDALLRNPLSAQHFMIPFWLFLGTISAAVSGPPAPSRPSAA
ncbi:MAG: O-antigen ligase family protein, partial [Thermoanaerobaculia bacterium]